VAQAVVEQLGSARSTTQLLEMVSAEPQSSTNVVDIFAAGTDRWSAPKSPTPLPTSSSCSASRPTGPLWPRSGVSGRRAEIPKQGRAGIAYGLMLKEKYENCGSSSPCKTAALPSYSERRHRRNRSRPGPSATASSVSWWIVLGVGLAFLLDYLDRRIKDDKAVEKGLGVPVLASVPLVGGADAGKNVTA